MKNIQHYEDELAKASMKFTELRFGSFSSADEHKKFIPLIRIINLLFIKDKMVRSVYRLYR